MLTLYKLMTFLGFFLLPAAVVRMEFLSKALLRDKPGFYTSSEPLILVIIILGAAALFLLSFIMELITNSALGNSAWGGITIVRAVLPSALWAVYAAAVWIAAALGDEGAAGMAIPSVMVLVYHLIMMAMALYMGTKIEKEKIKTVAEKKSKIEPEKIEPAKIENTALSQAEPEKVNEKSDEPADVPRIVSVSYLVMTLVPLSVFLLWAVIRWLYATESYFCEPRVDINSLPLIGGIAGAMTFNLFYILPVIVVVFLGVSIVSMIIECIVFREYSKYKWSKKDYVLAAMPTVLNLLYMTVEIMLYLAGKGSVLFIVFAILAVIYHIVMMRMAFSAGVRIRKKMKTFKVGEEEKEELKDKNLFRCRKCGWKLKMGSVTCECCGEVQALDSLYASTAIVRNSSLLAFRWRRVPWWAGMTGMSESFDEDMTQDEARARSMPGFALLRNAMMIMLVLLAIPALRYVFFRTEGCAPSYERIYEVVSPAYKFLFAAIFVVFAAGFFLNGQLIKAVRDRYWEKKAGICVLIAFGLWMVLAAVMVFILMFVDEAALNLVPVIVFFCVVQLALLIVSKQAEKHIALYKEYEAAFKKKSDSWSLRRK